MLSGLLIRFHSRALDRHSTTQGLVGRWLDHYSNFLLLVVTYLLSGIRSSKDEYANDRLPCAHGFSRRQVTAGGY
jgi:hypothetical protein